MGNKLTCEFQVNVFSRIKRVPSGDISQQRIATHPSLLYNQFRSVFGIWCKELKFEAPGASIESFSQFQSLLRYSARSSSIPLWNNFGNIVRYICTCQSFLCRTILCCFTVQHRKIYLFRTKHPKVDSSLFATFTGLFILFILDRCILLSRESYLIGRQRSSNS